MNTQAILDRVYVVRFKRNGREVPVCKLVSRGITAKRLDSTYPTGIRSRTWLKSKRPGCSRDSR